MVNNVKVIEKVYPFTNENLSSYESLYDFKDKRVLSVIGSGDQYFSSCLFGAREVDLFDINSGTILYFCLKFFAIKNLSYEEFYEFFVNSKLENMNIYDKLREKLPKEAREFFDHVLKVNRKLSSLLLPVVLNSDLINYTSGRVVPYFDRDNYYLLQSILNKVEFPNIYSASLQELYKMISGNYDIMLFSNIYMYLSMDESEFKSFIEENYFPHLSDSGVIQAHYNWNYGESLNSFENLGFSASKIPSIRANDNLSDYVLSLRKVPTCK